MAEKEMFRSALRSTGDLAGVFEYDGDTGYFYLYETNGADGQRVVGAIPVLTMTPDFSEDDLEIRWDSADRNVGLFIRQRLWAAFDGETGAQFGGRYRAGGQPQMPPQITHAFEPVGNE
jgi:hypothetical protein